ncbi:ATP-binding cassette domain-containing protein [Bradyrhizobium lupini]|uniref:ATP-binding cassette domain-containing protein n=1 Tax=Rhizobium lupini TaxID=136996 RepID=UPI00367247C8
MRGASVSLRSVGKSFAGRTVLDDIDLDIAAGQFVSIIGPSGAGKSTLLRLVARLDAPSHRASRDGPQGGCAVDVSGGPSAAMADCARQCSAGHQGQEGWRPPHP